jgi:hypothetical protein
MYCLFLKVCQFFLSTFFAFVFLDLALVDVLPHPNILTKQEVVSSLSPELLKEAERMLLFCSLEVMAEVGLETPVSLSWL